MITNTCLTGGSFVAEPPAAELEVLPSEPEVLPSEPEVLPSEPEVLPSEPEVLPSEPEVLPLELDGAFAAAFVVLPAAAGAGVGSDSDAEDEGSPPGAEGEDSDVDVDVDAEAEAPDGPEAGSTTFRGERAAASVPTREPATLPRSTPKPRNTSTSSAETRGGGSLRLEDVRTSTLAAGTGAARALRRWRPRDVPAPARRRSSSSCGLRDPTRAPHARQ